MRRALPALLTGWLVLYALLGAAQTASPYTFIQPAQVLLPVGQSQSFQLLGNEGNEESSAGWSLSDPDIADLEIDEGHAMVTGKTPGLVKLLNSSGTPAAEIHVHDGNPSMPQDSRWILRAIDGQFAHAFWASGTWGGSVSDADPQEEKHAAYFYEDRGSNSSHVRAIQENGLQVWQWPAHQSKEMPRMICGDVYGGVLLYVGDLQSRVLVNLDTSGHERWRIPVPGFSGKNFTYTMNGLLYIVEADPHGTGARIIGLDAKTGRQTFSLELPASREMVRNMEVRNGRLICSPGAENSTLLPVRHSKMMSNIEQVANLAYSEFSLVADAGECKPGAAVDPQQVRIKAMQRLMMVDIYENQTTSTGAIEASTTDGKAGDSWIQAIVPTGDIIVGEAGTGNFLAVRKTKQQWRGTGPGSIEEFQYRISDDRTVKYRVPVPVSPLGFPSSMLLGENNVGYTTRGRVVLAFDTRSGHEIWRWESTKSEVLACIALTNDEVLVHEGDGYTILKDGKPESHREEDYMLFVAKFRPDPESF